MQFYKNIPDKNAENEEDIPTRFGPDFNDQRLQSGQYYIISQNNKYYMYLNQKGVLTHLQKKGGVYKVIQKISLLKPEPKQSIICHLAVHQNRLTLFNSLQKDQFDSFQVLWQHPCPMKQDQKFITNYGTLKLDDQTSLGLKQYGAKIDIFNQGLKEIPIRSENSKFFLFLRQQEKLIPVKKNKNDDTTTTTKETQHEHYYILNLSIQEQLYNEKSQAVAPKRGQIAPENASFYHTANQNVNSGQNLDQKNEELDDAQAFKQSKRNSIEQAKDSNPKITRKSTMNPKQLQEINIIEEAEDDAQYIETDNGQYKLYKSIMSGKIKKEESKTYDFELIVKKVNDNKNKEALYLVIQDTISKSILRKKKLSSQYTIAQENLVLTMENSGNVSIRDTYYQQIVWQTHTGGLHRQLLYWGERLYDSVADPILFIGDTYSDIFLLYEFYTKDHIYYFTILVTLMIVERLIAISVRFFVYHEDRKKNNIFTRPFLDKHKWIIPLTSIFYLEPFFDTEFRSYKDKQIFYYFRRFSECFIEALPSIFLNIHSIFYLLRINETIGILQYISLFISILSASKTLFDLKIMAVHGKEAWQKMMGKKLYEEGEGKVFGTIYVFLQIALYLITYSYSFGVFTDMTRPYGVSYFLGGIGGFIFIVTIPLSISTIKDEWNSTDSFCYKLCKVSLLIFGPIIMSLCSTTSLGMGGYFDWCLSTSVEPANDALTGLQMISPYFRMIIASIFVGYALKENLTSDDYLYYWVIYLHFILYTIYFLAFICRTWPKCSEICKRSKEKSGYYGFVTVVEIMEDISKNIEQVFEKDKL